MKIHQTPKIAIFQEDNKVYAIQNGSFCSIGLVLSSSGDDLFSPTWLPRHLWDKSNWYALPGSLGPVFIKNISQNISAELTKCLPGEYHVQLFVEGDPFPNNQFKDLEYPRIFFAEALL